VRVTSTARVDAAGRAAGRDRLVVKQSGEGVGGGMGWRDSLLYGQWSRTVTHASSISRPADNRRPEYAPKLSA
jgi:hypothetical protein